MKFFNRIKTPSSVVTPASSTEIHEAFEAELDQILSALHIEPVVEDTTALLIKKREQLENLGFKSSKPVQETQELADELAEKQRLYNEARAVHRVATYYHERYPLYKFITREAVERLCKKYNLVFAEVGMYIGDIPTKNVEELANMKVDDEDSLYREPTSFAWEDRYRLRFFKKDGRSSKHPLLIVAPLSDFDRSIASTMEGYELLKKMPAPLDPIVLYPVVDPHGWGFKENKAPYFLIATAWGDEAADPEVVNPIRN